MNHFQRLMVAIGVLCAGLVSAAPAAAGDFMITPYVWFEGLDGDGDVNGRLWAADADPFDLDHYDGGGAVTVEAKGEKWAFLGSISAVDVDQETLGIAGTNNVTAEQTMLEGVVGYRLTRGGLYVVGGARSFDYDVTLRGGGSTQDSSSWIDPVVGLWYRADARRWGVSVEADVGVGGDSDTTYHIGSLFFWHFSHTVSLTLGYKAVDMHYEDEGAGFRMHAVTKGPLAGLAFRF